ncbi:MAG: hypothetical protein ACI39H_01265 [Lachnospiraceae bacterium]
MDLRKMTAQMDELIEMIDHVVTLLEEGKKEYREEMKKLFEDLNAFLPGIFYFIEQTEIGSVEMIVQIIKDVEEGIAKDDTALLSDSLLFGLESTLEQYKEIINEALYEE